VTRLQIDARPTSEHPSAHVLRAAIAVSLVACAGARAPRSASFHVSAACVFAANGTPAPDSINIVLTAPASSGDLLARGSPVARFVDAQMYETLVHLDCDGKLTPGLARSWSSDATARTTLRLREDARFWNGESVTARDVVAAWQRTASSGDDAASAAIARAIIDVASIVDDHSIAVPDADARMLADPALAVSRRPPPPASGAPWPEGTGRYRVSSMPGTRTIALTPVAPGADTPRLFVLSATNADARDRLDGGVDLLVTSDPTVTSYAAARPDMQSLPLPWDKTYVLLVPRHTQAGASSGTSAADSVRAALARDAVRGDARPTMPPYWWRETRGCTADAPGQTRAPISSLQSSATRIVYRSDDAVARQVAQRLVALAAMPGAGGSGSLLATLAPELAVGRALTADGLDASGFVAAMAGGQALAYVEALPARPVAPCQRIQGLLAAAPWLPGASAVIPLIDTHARAIMRADRLSFVIDWDGVLRIASPSDISTATKR